jgi:pimeloyl-ACP methyl ester carboxylesterase
MPTADLHIRIHYEIDGEGPPLLLLAGMMSDSASWGPLVPLLTPHFTVIRPDNRTTGRTDPTNPSLDAWAQDAVALLDHLGLQKAHIAGHSLGGLIATHLAATAPARVDRLALLAAAPVFLQRNIALFRHLIALRDPAYPPDLWLRALFPWLFHPRTFDSPAIVDTMVALSLAYPHAQTRTAMETQLAAYEAAEAALRIPDPLPPTLAILAQDDLLMPASLARPALSAITGLRVAEIPQAGHSLHWDAPDATASALIGHFTAP